MKQELQGVFVIYSRKSKFTGKGERVENQVEMCRNYIASVYGPQAAEAALVYEDDYDEDEYVKDAYDTCPECGKRINRENDGGNGFCIDCAANH